MRNAILYHSTARIWRLIAIALFCVGLSLFSIIAPSDATYHGPYSSFVASIGPRGLYWLMIFFGLGSVLLLIACLRLVFSSNQEAALADDDGVTLRTMWGTKRFLWHEIMDSYVKTSTVQSVYGRHSNKLLKIESRSRWAGVLSINTIRGGEAAAQGFVAIVKAQIAQLRAAETSLPPSAG